MKKRALLVGINYPGTPHALRGCVNDVRLMNTVLAEKYGFTDAKERRMLTDASATTQNIMERLEWLVDGAQPGDVLYFHYSGHGSQVIDTNYDDDYEPDGKDEIICPVDLDWRTKIIRDDDMKRVFDKVPEGVNLTVMLDCCHSGSGIDSTDYYRPLGEAAPDFDPLSPNKNRSLPIPADIENRGFGLHLDPKQRKVKSTGEGILISGCQAHQTSADSFIGNKYMGAATFFLVRALQKNRFDMTYQKLVRKMNRELKEFGYAQRPELNGDSADFDRKFLQPMV